MLPQMLMLVYHQTTLTLVRIPLWIFPKQIVIHKTVFMFDIQNTNIC